MQRHCGTNNRAPRWTFTDPCKPEVIPGDRNESASPAWLAAPAMNARDTTKVNIPVWMLDTGCGPTLYRKCHSQEKGKGIITLESNHSWGTVLPAPHGKGRKCEISFERTRYIDLCLKLVRTNLNYCILGTSTVAIFLSNDHFPYASIITLDECHAWFHLYGTSRPARNASKTTKFRNEKFLPTSGLKPTTLRFVARCSTDWTNRALMKAVLWKLPLNIHVLLIIGISLRMMK